MNTDPISPSKINVVTEHKENYKLISLFLMDSYNGLHPSLLSKLSHVIFNLIIYNKMYRNANNKNYSLEEDKRIYSNMLITPESILKRLAPSKYQFADKNMSNDISNLMSRIQTLDDYNIFYTWRYKQPYTYVFILERDVGCWKYYNSSAFVTPKTLKKIVRSGKCIIDTMIKLETKKNREVDKEDIEKSFGNFLNKMIDKMNPSVIAELSKWVDTANIYEYLVRLLSDLKSLDDFQGQIIAADFLNKLPESVRKEILNRKTKEKKDMDPFLELELIPQNENITSKRSYRKTKSIPQIKSEPSNNEARSFTTINPFDNALSFLKFYRSVIRSQDSSAQFYSIESETPNAQVVLDTLIKNNRNEDKKFLKMWIYNFLATVLKGNNASKTDKTSMKSFLSTFLVFNGSYYG